jgi:hypothetical protein
MKQTIYIFYCLAKLRNYSNEKSHFAVRNNKKSPHQESGLGNRGHLKDQFGVIQNLQTSPILQPSFLVMVGTFVFRFLQKDDSSR